MFRGKTMRKLHQTITGFAFVMALLFTAATDTARADWNNYKPANLTESLSKYKIEFKDTDIPKDAVKVDIHPGAPLRVTVRYLGKKRDLNQKRGTLIFDMWGKALQKDPGQLRRVFQKEIQVQDGQKTYWLPIQNVLLDPLEKEVGENGTVELWVLFIGAIERDFVFLVNEFQAQ